MPPDHQAVTWMLFSLWFLVYWILGGVFFAVLSATRFMNPHKAMFSCLFTFGSIVAAYGATITGLSLAGKDCSYQSLGEVLSCNYIAIFSTGGLFLVVLLTLGMVALLVSRVEKSRSL